MKKVEKNSNTTNIKSPIPSHILLAIEEKIHEQSLDTSSNKYDLVLLARRWAYEIKGKEGEIRSWQQVLLAAIGDILEEKVTAETILALPPIVISYKKARGGGPLDVVLKPSLKTSEKA